MNKSIVQFEVSSLDELREQILQHPQDSLARYAQIRVIGPQIITQQFQFPLISTEDLVAGLKLESSEILSVNIEDIELTYVITDSNEEGIQGVFSATTRQVVKDCFDCFNNHRLTPNSLMSASIGGLIDFFESHATVHQNYCLINFLRSTSVNIIIFTDGKLTLVRELNALNDSNFKLKVKDTIRYACSRSASKTMEEIFFVGELTGKEDLMKSVKELENVTSVESSSVNQKKVLDLSSLNFFKKYVVSVSHQAQLTAVCSLITVVTGVFCIVVMFSLVTGYVHLSHSKNTMKMDEYQQALDLQEEIRRMNHAE